MLSQNHRTRATSVLAVGLQLAPAHELLPHLVRLAEAVLVRVGRARVRLVQPEGVLGLAVLRAAAPSTARHSRLVCSNGVWVVRALG